MKWYDLIREARLAIPGMSQKALAHLVGVSQPLIAKIEAGRIEKTDALPRIIQALNLNIEHFPKELYDLYGNKAVFDLKVSAESAKYFHDRVSVLARDPSQWAASQSLIDKVPLYPSSENHEGFLQIAKEPIGTLKRPPSLDGVKDGYAIYLLSTMMSPEFEPGDTAYVNPRMPALPNTPCMFYNIAETETLAILGRYVGSTGEKWTVQQFSPLQTHNLDRKTWTLQHRIVSKLFTR